MIRSAEEELTLRDYRETDAAALSRLALAGFEEFQSAYSDWAAMSASISQMPSLAAAGELIIAARRDGSRVLALHTSPIMTAALAMYREMGFVFQHDAPPISGVPSAVYLLGL